MSPELIRLEVWAHRLEILIDFISRDQYSSLDDFCFSYDFEDIYCTHDIRLEGPYRITIALTHEWLRCKMKYYFWFIGVTYPL